MARILVADDHEVVRAGVRQVLRDGLDGAQVGEAASAADVARELAREPWDLLVLDLSMPGAKGLDLLKEVHSVHPRLPILVLTMHPEEQYAVRALRAGASGYVTKDRAAAELCVAASALLAGRRYVGQALAQRLAGILAGERAPAEALSDREHEVLARIGAGRTLTEIGRELGISVKTVSTYRTWLLEKLGLSSTAELARWARDAGLA